MQSFFLSFFYEVVDVGVEENSCHSEGVPIGRCEWTPED